MRGTALWLVIERYRRGVFGWLFLLLFWAFNGLMVYAIFSGVSENAQKAAQIADPRMRAAFDAGTGLGIMILLVFWAAGAIVFALLAYFTRGRKEIIEVER